MNYKVKRLFCGLAVCLFLLGLPPSILATGIGSITPTEMQALENAQAVSAEENYIWFQGYVYRAVEDAPNFEKTYALTDGTHRASIHHLYVMRLKVNGRWQPAYCMEPDVQVHAGINYGGCSNEKINRHTSSTMVTTPVCVPVTSRKAATARRNAICRITRPSRS
mgnify:CR=1 FL=1